MEINFQKVAFFDVDNTIISIKSLISFIEYLEIRPQSRVKIRALGQFASRIKLQLSQNVSRTELNRQYFSLYKGVDKIALEQEAEKWFEEAEMQPNFYIDKTVAEIRRLQQEGFLIVFVTGSFLPLIAPLMKKLNVTYSLNTVPEDINNIYTGELIGEPCIGEVKRKRILRFALEHGVDLDESWAFGDDDSDCYMLDVVGQGVRVTSDFLG
jgi:HAD superfamily hydrolase (TIGR01490 family)